MEASIVLPVIIFTVITAVLIIMFFYSQMTERSRLHTALRSEAGLMTEQTIYSDPALLPDDTDAEIYQDDSLTGGQIYGKKYLVMSRQGILEKKGVFIIEGRCYAVDGPEYVRYCTLVKGIAGNDNEE